jgi:hypothetical protein
MQGYKEPGFQDRMKAAEQARSKAIARLKALPGVDPVVAAERAMKAMEREAAQAEKRARAKAEREKQAVKVPSASVPEAAQIAPPPPEPTDAERKAIRDERYAARKARRK